MFQPDPPTSEVVDKLNRQYVEMAMPNIWRRIFQLGAGHLPRRVFTSHRAISDGRVRGDELVVVIIDIDTIRRIIKNLWSSLYEFQEP